MLRFFSRSTNRDFQFVCCAGTHLCSPTQCATSLTDIGPKSCDGRMVSHHLPPQAEMNAKILGHTLFHTFSFSAKARGPWASKFAFKIDAHVAPYLGGLVTSLLPFRIPVNGGFWGVQTEPVKTPGIFLLSPKENTSRFPVLGLQIFDNTWAWPK